MSDYEYPKGPVSEAQKLYLLEQRVARLENADGLTDQAATLLNNRLTHLTESFRAQPSAAAILQKLAEFEARIKEQIVTRLRDAEERLLAVERLLKT